MAGRSVSFYDADGDDASKLDVLDSALSLFIDRTRCRLAGAVTSPTADEGVVDLLAEHLTIARGMLAEVVTELDR